MCLCTSFTWSVHCTWETQMQRLDSPSTTVKCLSAECNIWLIFQVPNFKKIKKASTAKSMRRAEFKFYLKQAPPSTGLNGCYCSLVTVLGSPTENVLHTKPLYCIYALELWPIWPFHWHDLAFLNSIFSGLPTTTASKKFWWKLKTSSRSNFLVLPFI